MTRTKHHRFAPSFVQLEDRTVPSGNVTANLVGTTLHVVGDAADNSVRLEGHGTGVVEVRGVNTTVNGRNKAVTFSNINALILFSLSGSDTFRIANTDVGDVSIGTGYDGDGRVEIDRCQMASVTIDTGLGNDFVRIARTILYGEAPSAISTSDGNDEIVVRECVAGALTVEGNGGDDAISISRCTFASASPIEGLFELVVAGDDGSRVFGSDIGNDTIRVTNCSMDFQDPIGWGVFSTFIVLGDHTFSNLPGTYLGGNDTIEVSDFSYTGSSAVYSSMTFAVYGDYVGEGATLLGGNDQITVRNVHVLNTGLSPDPDVSPPLDIRFDITGGYISGAGTIIGDNDIIRVQNTSVVLDSPGPGDFMSLAAYIRGDVAYVDYGSGDRGTIVGGNDIIEITNSEFRNDDGIVGANILGEEGYDTAVTGGNDQFTLTNVDVIGANASVWLSGEVLFNFFGGPGLQLIGGEDTFTLRGVTVQSTMSGPWDEAPAVLSVYSDQTSSPGNGGADTVTIRNSSSLRLELDTQVGNDHVEILNSTFDSVSANLGKGNDTAVFRGLVAREVTISEDLFWGNGDDCVDIRNCSFSNLIVSLGTGNDTLTLKNNEFDTVTADLGDGDDTATVIHNTATVSLSIAGGSGSDTLIARNNIAPMLVFDGFEL